MDSRWNDSCDCGAQIFIAFWFIAALVNMWMGVVRAGYSIAEEFPIFLGIFAISGDSHAIGLVEVVVMAIH
jgi:hypothetical protein